MSKLDANESKMRRDTDVDKITFPVSLKTIFYRPKKENTEREIKSYKAVVNEKTGDVLSIVSKDYRLVSNAEAIEYGMECYKKVFQVDNLVNFEIFNIVSSYRGTFCHVDIICLLYTSPSPRDISGSRMPSSA